MTVWVTGYLGMRLAVAMAEGLGRQDITTGMADGFPATGDKY